MAACAATTTATTTTTRGTHRTAMQGEGGRDRSSPRVRRPSGDGGGGGETAASASSAVEAAARRRVGDRLSARAWGSGGVGDRGGGGAPGGAAAAAVGRTIIGRSAGSAFAPPPSAVVVPRSGIGKSLAEAGGGGCGVGRGGGCGGGGGSNDETESERSGWGGNGLAAATTEAPSSSSDSGGAAEQANPLSDGGSETLYDRTAKVPKTKYGDHGSHGMVVRQQGGGCGGGGRNDNVLKRLVFSAKDTYECISSEASASACATSSADVPPYPQNAKKRVSPSLKGNHPRGVAAASMSSSSQPSSASTSSPKAQHARRASPPAANDDDVVPMPTTSGIAETGRPFSNAVGLRAAVGDAATRGRTTNGHPPPSSSSGLLHTALLRRGNIVSASAAAGATTTIAARARARASNSSSSDVDAASGGNDSPPVRTTAEGAGGSGGAPSPTATGAGRRRADVVDVDVDDDDHECLTSPSDPCSNHGLDNAEGNLIVRRNDVLRLPRRHVHDHRRRRSSDGGNDDGGAAADPPTRGGSLGGVAAAMGDDDDLGGAEEVEYRVLDPLGQGTFAQVFRCADVSTGRKVAVKIVKNKPAYTRQAAVEIDVFRALAEDPPRPRGGGGGGGGHPGGGGGAGTTATGGEGGGASRGNGGDRGGDNMVNLLCYFMYRSHLCLVFELLGLNLYELLKKRQFVGLPIDVVRTLVGQAVDGVKDLSARSVVHCDLKPENILLVDEEAASSIVGEGEGSGGGERKEFAAPSPGGAADDDEMATSGRASRDSNDAPGPGGGNNGRDQKIKLIDFGSACFEGQTSHTYIQSRFYRSPEVLVGLPYDSAIDMWSLGCVAAELFLGLPILPGVHEHDQLGRICEMIGPIPDWMLDQGSKASKCFVKTRPTHHHATNPHAPPRTPSPTRMGSTPPPPRREHSWRLKTRKEYIDSLTADERNRRGGLTKLESQPTSRYFKRKKLADIIMLHGRCGSKEERESLGLFVHFLKGILDPDPWKRWTAYQATMHPFITRSTLHRRRAAGVPTTTADGHARHRGGGSPSSSAAGVVDDGTTTNRRGGGAEFDIYWVPPWDPAVCRRRLLSVQKAREKSQQQQQQQQQAMSISRGNHRTSSGGGAASSSVGLLGIGRYQGEPTDPSSPDGPNALYRGEPVSPEFSGTSRVTAMTDAMSLSQSLRSQPAVLPVSVAPQRNGLSSPPPTLDGASMSLPRGQQHLPLHVANAQAAMMLQPQAHFTGSLGHLPPPAYGSVPGGSNFAAEVVPPGARGNGFADRHYASAVMMSPALQGGGGGALYGDYSFNPNQFPTAMSAGPQSFSGVYSDRSFTAHHLPEGDLGYALQRPGVVPSMGSGDGLTSAVLPQQQPQGPGLTYLTPPQMVRPTNAAGASLGRPGSYTGGNVGMPMGRHTGRGRHHSYGNANPSMSTAAAQVSGFVPASPGSLTQPATMHLPGGHFLESPTTASIQEDVRDLNMQPHIQIHAVPPASPAQQRGGGNATSLLAQQLAEHSASNDLSSPDRHYPQPAGANAALPHPLANQDNPLPPHDQMQQQQQNYLHGSGVVLGSSGPTSNAGSFHGYYNMYLTSNGTPMMMSAPANVDPRTAAPPPLPPGLGQLQASSGSYGAYYDNVPLHGQQQPSMPQAPHPYALQGLHPPVPPAPQYMPMEVGAQGEQHIPAGAADYPNVAPRPPERYRGTSM